jgi:hypothetical protein
MALDILSEKGVPPERQRFTWRELAAKPYSKLDDDAFTRVRVVLLGALEAEAVRFGHACARVNGALRAPLARVRRAEQHQHILVKGLHPPDLSPLEATLGQVQACVEITASIAEREPDGYLAQVYRFGLLEQFDHLYCFSALADRVEGRDANDILQSYTDVRPGRPTAVQHRDPLDDLRDHYERGEALPLSKLHALCILALAQQARDHHLAVGSGYPDPAGRRLYAEIASVAEQHVTQYESIIDPGESWLEQWLLHEASEVYAYWSCAQQEDNRRLRGLWERLVDYELGHLHLVIDLMKEHEGRDAAALLPPQLPDPLRFDGQRDFIRRVLADEAELRAAGPRFIHKREEAAGAPSVRYREEMGAAGSPSEAVAEGYRYTPGTELAATRLAAGEEGRIQ